MEKDEDAPLSVVIIGKVVIIAAISLIVYLIPRQHIEVFVGIFLFPGLITISYLLFEWKWHPFGLIKTYGYMAAYVGFKILIISPIIIITIALDKGWYRQSNFWIVVLVSWGLIGIGTYIFLTYQESRKKKAK